MAVESKQNGTNGASANGARTAGGRKRPSSLMQHASALPTVEHSLEEFIAKANQTLVDVSGWGNADAEAKEADGKRREADALRMKAAETQMRKGEARETSLRRQLDGLQGKLAEAEARAAVAGTAVGSAAHDATLGQLRTQIEQAEAQRRGIEAEKAQLSSALEKARAEAEAARNSGPISTNYTHHAGDDSDANERVRVAEAKAAQAIAAAKAVQAGVPVDLSAIENGLSVPVAMPSGTPWGKVVGAFVVGLGLMAVLYLLVLKKDAAPATQPAPVAETQTAPVKEAVVAPTEEPKAAVKPTVEPIEEPVAAKPTAEPIEEPAAKAVVEEPKAVVEEPKVEPKKAEPKAVVVKKEPKKAEPKKAEPKKAEPKKAAKASSVVDPFADAPAPKKAPAKKPASGVVDPF